MLQTFLLIDEFAGSRSYAYTNTAKPTGEDHPDNVPASALPAARLRHMGFHVYTAIEMKEIAYFLERADAVLLSVAAKNIGSWINNIVALRQLPVLLWCDEFTFPDHESSFDGGINGMLSPGMTPAEVHCSLQISFRHFLSYREWQHEKEQLLAKLQERKWIDQAKSILCQIKRIPEAEAYDLLRKQAMNERKRMIDVAVSIVKVYELLQEQKKGTSKK